MNKLLSLTPLDCEKNRVTKILNKDLELVESFSSGSQFYFDTITTEDFHKSVAKAFELENSFVVLGALTEFGELLEQERKNGYRRKKNKDGIEPTIKDRRSNEIVLDIDEIIIEDYDALSPLKGIQNFLDKHEINCDVTWQITSGQKLNTDCARIRLYFECSENVDLQTRKAWSQSIGADGSVYTCSQPIYTAPPIIEGGVDPIQIRHGKIKGEYSNFQLPKLSKEDKQKYSKSYISIASESYDFSARLPKEVKDGKVYRRYFMPYAFSLANKGLSRDEILILIEALSSTIKSREFSRENVEQYIDSALATIEQEQENQEVSEDQIESAAIKFGDHPTFPFEALRKLPEPIPMIFDNFSRNVNGIYDETVVFLYMSAVLSFYLESRYLNDYRRRPNLLMLSIVGSSQGKDSNSTETVRNISQIIENFKKKEGRESASNIFNEVITLRSKDMTGDTAFLNNLERGDGSLFVHDTEATSTIQRINNKANESVAALGSKFIEATDGHTIAGKTKAKKAESTENFDDPNVQIFLAGQPETTGASLTKENISSGFLSRCFVYVKNIEEFDSFNLKDIDGLKRRSENELDKKFCEFFTSKTLAAMSLPSEKAKKYVVDFSDSQRDKIRDWRYGYLDNVYSENKNLLSLVERASYPIENLLCVFYGICREWDIHFGNEGDGDCVRHQHSFDIDPFIEIAEYFFNMKLHLIANFLSNDLDPLEEVICEILFRLKVGDLQHTATYRKNQPKDGATQSAIKALINNGTKYKKRLNGMMDYAEKIQRKLDALSNSGEIIQNSVLKSKPVYEIAKEKFDELSKI